MRKSMVRLLLTVGSAWLAVAFVTSPACPQPFFDHLTCYKIKPDTKVKGTLDLEPLQTQFPPEMGCKFLGPKLFCVPAEKTNVTPAPPGAAPGPQETDHLCYKVKCPKPVLSPLAVADQLGTFNVEFKKASMVCTPARKECDCCSGANLLSFKASVPGGNCGILRNFRCAGADLDFADNACVADADCDFGPCVGTLGICSGNFSISCTADADCIGTCGEVTDSFLPADLACGGWHQGGGSNSFPLPFRLSDTMTLTAKVTGCDGGTGALTLAGATAGDTGSSLTCTSPGCLFGPPVPVPNVGITPTSHCDILTVRASASGAATCGGSIASLELPLGLDIFLTGDILSSTSGPVDVPGIQSCPLCSPQCVGGGDAGQPCQDDSDCSGTCDGTPNCIGGPNDGDPCTPGSSALTGSFPTSHDCAPDPLREILSDFPLDLSLTTGQVTVNAIDHANSRRAFCGFCRDGADGCFEGDPSPACPGSVAESAIPCTDDSDCTEPYESCAQRNSGAFSFGSATQISLAGSSAGECLADAQPHDATLVSTFCIPPSFDPLVDAALDWPGPGAVMLEGQATLSP